MKLKRTATMITLITMVSMLSLAQRTQYPLTKEQRNAYDAQTRSTSGLPGPKYWQNRADYTIQARVDASENLVEGSCEIKYQNNSPDTLNRLVVNVYQDIFRKGNSRDWDLGAEDLHDGLIINKLIVNGEEIDPKDRKRLQRQGTKLIIRPAHKIYPGTSSSIEISWEVQLPAHRTVRMGRYDDSTLFVAYWYPQMAVYDDIDGWDMVSYGGSVEFYNEFGDYDLKLTTSDEWMVWASGELQNADEIYDKEIIRKIERVLNSDEVVRIVDQGDHRKKHLKGKGETEWHFIAKNVPDMSFGMGKGFNWDACQYTTADHRKVLISAVYKAKDSHFGKVADMSRQSIRYMSEMMPGVAFPYPSMTTFCNGRNSGGMESPMMANNGIPEDEASLFGLTFHEIAHTYMPFFMGTNEKKHAWMDEGWASLWPLEMMDSLYPQNQYLERTVETFQNAAGTAYDIPPIFPNQLLSSHYPSLRLASYVRPAMAYHFLEDALGSEVFKAALRAYMHQWNGKHPQPMDFIRMMEIIADQDLKWFFKPWLFEQTWPDLGIGKITNNGELVIENKGGLPIPIVLEVRYSDQTTEKINYSSAVWRDHPQTVVIGLPNDKHVMEVKLGSKRVPDMNIKDNYLLLID